MSVFRIAVAALGLAATVAQHPAVRAGVRAVAANPKLKDAAAQTTMNAAYSAGRLARRIVPRRPSA